MFFYFSPAPFDTRVVIHGSIRFQTFRRSKTKKSTVILCCEEYVLGCMGSGSEAQTFAAKLTGVIAKTTQRSVG